MLSLHTSLVKMLRSVVYNTTFFPPSIYGCIRTGVVGYRGYSSKWLAEMVPRGMPVTRCADVLTASPNVCSMRQLQVHIPKGVSRQRLLLNQTSTLASRTSEMGALLSPTSIQQPCYGGCCIAEIGAFPLHLRTGASASAFISTSCMPYSSSLYPAEMINTRFAPI